MTFFTALKYRGIFRLLPTYLDERVPNFDWNQHGSCFATLAIDCYLSTDITFLQMSPFEAGNLRDSKATAIERQQDGSISWVVLSSQYSQNFGLRQNSLGQFISGWSGLAEHDQRRSKGSQA